MMNLNLDSRAGFSMIELLVGVAILSLALVPIAGFFITNTQLVDDTEEQSRALKLARRVIEDMKGTVVKAAEEGQDFTAELEEAEESWNQKSPTDLKEEFDLTDEYNIEVTVEDYEDSENLKKLTVAVFWNLKQEHPPKVELETLLARR